MKIDVLTLFPDMFDKVFGESILGRARKNNLIDINIINIRDYSANKHKKVDDYPYGGGRGMLMAVQPIYDAYRFILSKCEKKPYVIYMSPQGRVLTQNIVKELVKAEHIVLLCGHYEGIDQRIIDEIVDEEISIGDYVLTGGEIAAMVLTDCISRLIPGVLTSEEAFTEESHFDGLLEYPQYTRPAEFLGRKVPDVLLSGNHLEISKWRREEAINNTRKKRPDLYKKLNSKN